MAGIAEAAQDIERLVDAHFVTLAGLPAPEDHAPRRTEPAVLAQAADARTSPTCRILVVDDDHAARTGLVLLLEAWGACVQSFADIESLERWLSSPQAIRPDLLMLDYHLPRPGDGLIALRLVRQTWPAQPVHTLLITGDRQAAVANALTDGGF